MRGSVSVGGSTVRLVVDAAQGRCALTHKSGPTAFVPVAANVCACLFRARTGSDYTEGEQL